MSPIFGRYWRTASTRMDGIWSSGQVSRARESNPIQVIHAEGLRCDTGPTESGQKSNTFSTLGPVGQTPEKPESDTSQTPVKQNPDTVEGRSCGHCVAHSSEHRADEARIGEPKHVASEPAGGTDGDGLELVVTSWPRLSKDVRDSVVKIIQTSFGSR